LTLTGALVTSCHIQRVSKSQGAFPMLRLSSLVGVVLLGCAFLVNTGVSQEKKDPAKKTQLPQGFSKLNLSKDQKAKMYEAQTKYRVKIKALEEQITELRSQERMELVNLLTPDQRDLYRKIQLGEDTKKSGDK
jgi:Spy/CpxP family protein refolding chaperone